MNSQILLMLQLQNQLNNATNGEEWVRGATKNNKKINWRRCIYMECAEMIDSFGWKHWKNIEQEPDWDNLQIEVVDVWHFIMSLLIEEFYKEMKGGVDDVAAQISESKNLQLLQSQEKLFASQEELMQKIEALMRHVLCSQKVDTQALVDDFFALAAMSSLNLDTLYRLYVGKNILNQFRQDNGYKDGTYIKVWDGDEDNVVMKRIWEEHKQLKPDELYKELAKAYFSLTKSV
jgi:dimeric dUTPase (all-alpha-NTP-PPase superfamily)